MLLLFDSWASCKENLYLNYIIFNHIVPKQDIKSIRSVVEVVIYFLYHNPGMLKLGKSGSLNSGSGGSLKFGNGV